MKNYPQGACIPAQANALPWNISFLKEVVHLNCESLGVMNLLLEFSQ